MTVARLAALAAGLLFATLAVRTPAADPTFTPDQLAFFDKDVKPVLDAHCLKCHGVDGKVKGGLDLTSRKGALAGGDTGPAFDAANPSKSLLLKALDYKDEHLRMPPKGKLPDKDIATLTKWVTTGLAMPAGDGAQAVKPKAGVVTEEAKRYWAYQPVKRPAVPPGAAHPIDAFINAKLGAKGLKPVGPADKVALVRRAYYDLHGLPPTPEQVDAFVADTSPDAWEKLIDTLLASPHYGEKWGRHWLDVVRFAETNGYERDGPKPHAWKYRDYVIRSFNADKPFDRFIREQIAGDEMPGFNPDAVIATGYHRLGLWDDEPADKEQALYDGYDDLVTVTAQGFLGMTINCARCHDHKVDPIPQADYYRLVAFFRDIRPFSDTRGVVSSNNTADITPPEKRAVYEAELKTRTDRLGRIVNAMTAIEDAVIKTLPAEDQRASEGLDRPLVVRKAVPLIPADQQAEYKRLRAERTEIEKKSPPPSQELAMAVNNCDPRPPTVHVMARGNPHAPTKPVAPGFPEVLGVPDPKIPAPGPGAKTSGRRTVLADWLASPANPLTPRVIVNRVWQGHFGRGIVPTANDFGKLGEMPTHPELLDWLASELVAPTGKPHRRDGEALDPQPWALKRLHKLVMTSAAYRRSAAADGANLKADPANALYWRFNMRRLNAEEVRDSILAASGSLNRAVGGPSVFPKIPAEILAGQSVPGQGWPTSPPDQANRRSVYVSVKRSLQVPILATHDQADTDSSCPVRYTTTVPTQALGLLNGEFANGQAAALAERLEKDAPNDLEKQVARGIRLTTARTPAADEVKRDAAFVRELRAKFKLDDHAALTRYALLLLNANEFVYLD